MGPLAGLEARLRLRTLLFLHLSLPTGRRVDQARGDEDDQVAFDVLLGVCPEKAGQHVGCLREEACDPLSFAVFLGHSNDHGFLFFIIIA
jgi:hypothetical protein